MRSRSNRTRRGRRPDVTRLRVKEGDVLVVHFDQYANSLYQIHKETSQIQAAVGYGVKVMAATTGVHFSVLETE